MQKEKGGALDINKPTTILPSLFLFVCFLHQCSDIDPIPCKNIFNPICYAGLNHNTFFTCGVPQGSIIGPLFFLFTSPNYIINKQILFTLFLMFNYISIN